MRWWGYITYFIMLTAISRGHLPLVVLVPSVGTLMNFFFFTKQNSLESEVFIQIFKLNWQVVCLYFTPFLMWNFNYGHPVYAPCILKPLYLVHLHTYVWKTETLVHTSCSILNFMFKKNALLLEPEKFNSISLTTLLTF